MRYVFAGVLVVSGAMLIGLAYHNQIGAAWNVLRSKS